jgi:hypothetical protein
MVWRCSREYNTPTTDKIDPPNEQYINRGRWHVVDVAWCQHSTQPSLRIWQARSGTVPDALRVQLFAQWDSVSLIPPTPHEQSMTDKVTWHRRNGVSAQKSPVIRLTSRLAGHRHSGSAVVDCTTWLCLISPLCGQIPNNAPRPSQTKLIHLASNPKTGAVQWHYSWESVSAKPQTRT